VVPGVWALHSAPHEGGSGSRKRVANGTISCSTFVGVFVIANSFS